MKKAAVLCLVVLMLILNDASVVLGQSGILSRPKIFQKCEDLNKEAAILTQLFRDTSTIRDVIGKNIQRDIECQAFANACKELTIQEAANLVYCRIGYLIDSLYSMRDDLALYSQITGPHRRKYAQGFVRSQAHSSLMETDADLKAVDHIVSGTYDNAALIAEGMRMRDEFRKCRELLRSIQIK